jgi:hypothetical protein
MLNVGKISLALLLSLGFVAGVAHAQKHTFTREGIEFVLELPSPTWRVVSRLDVHDHVEFIYGDDCQNGYLRLRKNFVERGTTGADLFQRDQMQSLRLLPGYVVCDGCNGERFAGRLSGARFTYEYTSGDRPMMGRIYYLQVDNRSIYTLHFTGTRERLQLIQNEMDSIARSFRMK